ncbi:hypothetical protein XZ53_004279 [Salmonella enterica subsp. enterica]|nr:hypothetical protein [Salmonella enterica subsp. enterica]EEJ3337889.1 hypothetical protein [Salmonella enterica subsp. enterica]EEJ8578371.1 hypothetical protein [Salmonella enterica subsp. enterica serovar Saintpaul]
MTTVGQRERATQQRVVRFFIEELGYRYLGDWHTRPNNRNVEPDLLSHWLIDRGVVDCPHARRQILSSRLGLFEGLRTDAAEVTVAPGPVVEHFNVIEDIRPG